MWKDQVEATLKPHLSENAVSAASALLAAFHTTEEVMAGRVTGDVRRAAAQMLVDLTVGLVSNPWWQKHGPFVMPVFAVAVNAWLDCGVYAQRAAKDVVGDPDLLRSTYVRSVLTEVVSAVAIADLGFARAHAISAKVRDAITALER